MNRDRKRLLAGLAVTGVLAGGLGAGGAALASTGSAPASAVTAAAPAVTATATPSSGPCDGAPWGMYGMWSGRQSAMKAAEDYLGLSQDQLRAQLQSGKSLADVAKEHGKSVPGLENAILAAVTSSINSSTTLNATQKAAMISDVKSHLDDIVNDTFPDWGGMSPAGWPGWDGSSPAGWWHG